MLGFGLTRPDGAMLRRNALKYNSIRRKVVALRPIASDNDGNERGRDAARSVTSEVRAV